MTICNFSLVDAQHVVTVSVVIDKNSYLLSIDHVVSSFCAVSIDRMTLIDFQATGEDREKI